MNRWKVIFFTAGLALFFVLASCRTLHLTGFVREGPDDSLRNAELDTLYASISIRNPTGIVPHIRSPFPIVRNLAWRSLHVTQIQVDTLFRLVEQSNDNIRWFALAGHRLDEQITDTLEEQWLNQPDQRSGIGLVLGMQGNRKVLKFLADNIDRIEGAASEYQNALALSRLYLKYPDYPSFYPLLINHALSAPDSVRHAYLYAAYRSTKTIFPDSLDTLLVNDWKSGMFVNDRLTRQMIERILADHKDSRLFTLYRPDQIRNLDANEANEWIDALGNYPVNDLSVPYYEALLQYPNRAVQGHLLDSFSAENIHNQLLMDQILMLADSSRSDDAYLFVKAIKAVSGVIDTLSASYRNRLQKAISKDPYLLNDVLQIRARVLKRADYFRNLVLLSLDTNALISEQGIMGLTRYWQDSDSLARDTLLPIYSTVINQVLQRSDRGETATISGLLHDPTLVRNVPFAEMQRLAARLNLPGDIEAIEAITPVLLNSFGTLGRSLVDSLAALGYPPYNRFLVAAGYHDIPPGIPSRFPLFRPDFDRLSLMGKHPLWKIQTNIGKITVKLNTYEAPATVTLIDSLSRSGAYRNIPFHRVVPDFVIQGGDVKRSDGYGGISVPLPTEPSEREFDRGAAGIASAGTDTEGPQFFFMHQWKPHLNGRYTRFGQVIDGMQVVDRIVPGDRVLSDTLLYEDR